jgi:hypothetical protein
MCHSWCGTIKIPKFVIDICTWYLLLISAELWNIKRMKVGMHDMIFKGNTRLEMFKGLQ